MSELSTISRHALTVLAGQLAVMAFGVTDTIVAGRYAQEALAALSIGSAVFISVYVGLMGVLQALMPVWAEQRGANAQAAIGRSVRQSLYLWAVATALGIPVSTTHTITGAIVGVGSTQRASAVRWGVAGNIVWAWVLTIPAAAFVAAFAYWVSLQLY